MERTFRRTLRAFTAVAIFAALGTGFFLVIETAEKTVAKETPVEIKVMPVSDFK